MASASSRSAVATTPSGGPPHTSPASRPAFSGEWTHSPASSRAGWAAMAGTAWIPTVPVAHLMTRIDMEHVLVRGRGRGAALHSGISVTSRRAAHDRERDRRGGGGRGGGGGGR